MRTFLLAYLFCCCPFFCGGEPFSDSVDSRWPRPPGPNPPSKWVKAKWAGGEVIRDGGGDGHINLESGDRGRAFLKVQCNSRQGYSVRFHAANATSDTSSKLLLNGVGGEAQQEIEYTAEMHCNQFRDTCNILVEELHLLSNSPSVVVDFRGGGELPDSAGEWNVIKLFLTLDSFEPFAKEAGEYSDIIIAEVTLN